VSSFPPLAFLYKERAGFFVRGHLITLSTLLEREAGFLEREALSFFFIMVFPLS